MAGELEETTPVNVLSGVDALLPNEIAARAEEAGVIKARRDILTLLVLSILAGAFIGLGALFSTTVTAGAAGEPTDLRQADQRQTTDILTDRPKGLCRRWLRGQPTVSAVNRPPCPKGLYTYTASRGRNTQAA